MGVVLVFFALVFDCVICLADVGFAIAAKDFVYTCFFRPVIFHHS